MSDSQPSAYYMLNVWGVRVSGKPIQSAGIYLPARGGSSGLDEAYLTQIYVESTEGFERSRRVLVWVFVKGRSISEFSITRPGETLHYSLLDQGLGMYLGRKPSEIAPAILEDFIQTLEGRLKESPPRTCLDVLRADTIPPQPTTKSA